MSFGAGSWKGTPPILPVGTKVVVRLGVDGVQGERRREKGAVGVVVESPLDMTHAYRVRFVEGGEVSLRREELAVLSHWQEGEPGAIGDYWQFVILRCVVGSRAFGLDDAGSDTDRRGVYLPPADAQWSLQGVPEQLENLETEECYWELEKFLVLALKANPNVLECLWTPIVEDATALGRELVGMREAFLSKLVYQTYNGYVLSQFKKLQGDLRNKGEVKWKHVMHLLRLLLSGITALREGVVPVRVEEHRERLLAIKRGEVALPELEEWRVKLHAEFDAAAAVTVLPDRPDYLRVNEFLLRARRSMVGERR